VSARQYAKQQTERRLASEWSTAREDARKALAALDPGRTTAVRGIVIARSTRYDEATGTHVDRYEVGDHMDAYADACERLAGMMVRQQLHPQQRRR